MSVYALLSCAHTASAGPRVEIGRFSAGDLAGWQTRTFDDIAASDYALVPVQGHTRLRANCQDSASFFRVRREIDLDKTPVLHWSWKVDRVFDDIDEREKSGDDFVARVYAVIDGGWFKWRTRALNYVWASHEPVGAHWRNPFRDEAAMVVVQSNTPRTAHWVDEKRNIKADFKRYFDKDADHIDGIALMTDCDNHGGSATAYYGDIYFAPR